MEPNKPRIQLLLFNQLPGLNFNRASDSSSPSSSTNGDSAATTSRHTSRARPSSRSSKSSRSNAAASHSSRSSVAAAAAAAATAAAAAAAKQRPVVNHTVSVPTYSFGLSATPAQRLIQVELKEAMNISVFYKGVRIMLDRERCNFNGVYVFYIQVFEKENSSEFPPVKLQVTEDYPGEIPMYLNFNEVTSSIANKRTKQKFEYAVRTYRGFQLAISETQYRIPNIVKLWSVALMNALRHASNLPKGKSVKK